MINRPYCNEHYRECICSRCKYDKEDCCGCGQFSTYMCPFNCCSEFKPKEMSEGLDGERVSEGYKRFETSDR